MFNQWKVLHLDRVESESILFCRALAHLQFAGHCESVQTFDQGKAYLERTLYTPQSFSRPDIIVVNCHPDCDGHVLEFVHWVRIQPQLHIVPIVVFIQAQLSFAAQERVQNEGVTDLIVRPGAYEDLLEEVQALLARCASRCVVR